MHAKTLLVYFFVAYVVQLTINGCMWATESLNHFYLMEDAFCTEELRFYQAFNFWKIALEIIFHYSEIHLKCICSHVSKDIERTHFENFPEGKWALNRLHVLNRGCNRTDHVPSWTWQFAQFDINTYWSIQSFDINLALRNYLWYF